MDKREIIARRVAALFKTGDLVNLGIGLPTTVANFLAEGVNITLQSENGFLGVGPIPLEGFEDYDLVNAGGQPVTILPFGSCFDSAASFGIIRGGHLTATVLGALEVDKAGNLANWMVPGKLVPGMGGAMDLVVGAQKVIVAMEHTQKDGSPKIISRCTLPLTAVNEVDIIVTELGMMEVTKEGIVVMELAEGVTVEEIQSKTGTPLITPEKIGVMKI